MEDLLNQLASEQVLTQAYRWLCQTRAHYHHNDDVWHVRYWWATHKPWLQAQLRTGTYRLSECRVVQGRERRSEIWCAMDALVLKALAIVLTEHLQPHLSRRCFHLAGTGGPWLGRQWSGAWHGASSKPTSSSFCHVLRL